jgi:hypothetical protein
MTIAVAGRMPGSYCPPRIFLHSVRVCFHPLVTNPHRTVLTSSWSEMPRPPHSGGLGYMKDGSPPWGGLGGYPFTPWERALGARGETSPSCMHGTHRPRRVRT